MTKIWIGVATLAVCAALAAQACTSSSSNPMQSDITAACMHICGCETGMPDLTFCESHCTMGSGQSSYSSFSSSISVSFSLAHASAMCVSCINSASCADLTSGVACQTECQ